MTMTVETIHDGCSNLGQPGGSCNCRGRVAVSRDINPKMSDILELIASCQREAAWQLDDGRWVRLSVVADLNEPYGNRGITA